MLPVLAAVIEGPNNAVLAGVQLLRIINKNNKRTDFLIINIQNQLPDSFKIITQKIY